MIGDGDELAHAEVLGAQLRIDAERGEAGVVEQALERIAQCLAALAEGAGHDFGEQLFVVLSRIGLAVLPSFVPPNAAGPAIQQATVQDLQTSLKPRDLVLERVANTTSPGEAGNFVINNDTGADAVTVSIELTHR